MNQVLNLSDLEVILSDEESSSVIRSPAQASPPTRARPASDRADRARFVDGDLQTLRPAQLPLHRWTWARPQEISLHNCANRGAPAARLRAQRSLRPSRRVPRQFPQAAGDAQRDLCDQCRTAAPPRKSRLDGSGRRHPRPRQGGYPTLLGAPRRPTQREPIMMISKIADRHLSRQACIYIRQSTPGQVRFNQESTERQYKLANKAKSMGSGERFPVSRIRWIRYKHRIPSPPLPAGTFN